MALDMRALEQLIDDYCSGWNEPDARKRSAIFEKVWAVGAIYTDPKVHVTGVDQLVAHTGKVIANRPGATVARTSSVDEHHGWARFNWKVAGVDGKTLAEGIDVVAIDSSQKLNVVVGFIGTSLSSFEF